MTNSFERSGLQIDADLARFIESEVLSPIGKKREAFWSEFSELLARFVRRDSDLLAQRDVLQARIDAWHVAHAGKPLRQGEYQALLRKIGHLVPGLDPFVVTTSPQQGPGHRS